MQSWHVDEPVALPGRGLPLRLYDAATQEIRPTAPQSTARMYVCGITPYDATHMGHAFTYVSFDVLQRVWRDAGHAVHYVQNVTDIDDPLLIRAAETGVDWQVIAQRETELFASDMQALNVLAPDDYVGAVESIPALITRVSQLQNVDAVYWVDQDMYFDTRADPHFGSVAGLSEAQMVRLFAERGGDPERIGKRHPLDPLVWQAARPGEPAWDSPMGAGRPGWHLECATIALDRLGMSFDVQGGGSDLAFPHHEMSASQAAVCTGEWPFARHFVHSGMVAWRGEKMSKSRGNLVFVSALRSQGVDPGAIRLALLAHHYRTDWAWSAAGLDGASERLTRFRQAAQCPGGPDFHPSLERMREYLSDDLRTPEALDVLDRWVFEALSGTVSDAQAPQQFAAACSALLGIDVAQDVKR